MTVEMKASIVSSNRRAATSVQPSPASSELALSTDLPGHCVTKQPKQKARVFLPLQPIKATMEERSTSPSPEERDKLDKEVKAKEIAEQATLPYKWAQQISDLDITAPIPSNIKGKDLDVKITKTSIKAAIKGQDAIIEVSQPVQSTKYLPH